MDAPIDSERYINPQGKRVRLKDAVVCSVLGSS